MKNEFFIRTLQYFNTNIMGDGEALMLILGMNKTLRWQFLFKGEGTSS